MSRATEALFLEWAATIRARADPKHVDDLASAICSEAGAQDANRADIVLACALLLGRVIAEAPPRFAAAARDGIFDLIDGFAMQAATEEDP